jgi:hypothetical protein
MKVDDIVSWLRHGESKHKDNGKNKFRETTTISEFEVLVVWSTAQWPNSMQSLSASNDQLQNLRGPRLQDIEGWSDLRTPCRATPSAITVSFTRALSDRQREPTVVDCSRAAPIRGLALGKHDLVASKSLRSQ